MWNAQFWSHQAALGPSLPANLFSPAGFAQSSFCAPPWLFSLKHTRPVHFPPLLYLWPFHCFHCASWNFLSVRRKCLWAYSETQPETPNWAGWSCGSINNWGKLYHRPCYVFCSKLFLWRSPLLQGYCGGYLWLSLVPKFGWGENCCPARDWEAHVKAQLFLPIPLFPVLWPYNKGWALSVPGTT